MHEKILAGNMKAGLYHSELKNDEREEVLRQFENNTYRVLVSVDALNAGLNIPDTDSAMCVSGVSTELTNTQQLGQIRPIPI